MLGNTLGIGRFAWHWGGAGAGSTVLTMSTILAEPIGGLVAALLLDYG